MTRIQDKEADAKALVRLAAIAAKKGAYDEARQVYDESWRTHTEPVGEALRGSDLFGVGESARERRDFEAAEAIFREALDTVKGQDDRLVALCKNRLGLSAHFGKRFAEAHERYLQSLLMFDQIGDEANKTVNFLNLGVTAAEMGDYATAMQLSVMGLEISQKLAGQETLVGESLKQLTWLLAKQQRYAEARQSQQQASLFLDRSNAMRSESFETLDGKQVPDDVDVGDREFPLCSWKLVSSYRDSDAGSDGSADYHA